VQIDNFHYTKASVMKVLQCCTIYKPPVLVFLDETGTDRRDAMRRFGYSYSLRGKPARTHKMLVRGKHLTAIAAICVEGILCCKIVEGSDACPGMIMGFEVCG